MSAGSQVTFNKVPMAKGTAYGLVGIQYDECISATFDICKNPDEFDDLMITNDEFIDIMRWLNRKEFKRMRVVGFDDERVCYYNASFNLSKIKIRDKLYGIELNMQTDKPFGYGAERVFSFNVLNQQQTFMIPNTSDEIGHLFPTVKITCGDSGEYVITNTTTSTIMSINNCSQNEVINIKCAEKIISSSVSSHHLYDDFNFSFLELQNSLDNSVNNITVNKPCTLEIRYVPIIKDCI